MKEQTHKHPLTFWYSYTVCIAKKGNNMLALIAPKEKIWVSEKRRKYV